MYCVLQSATTVQYQFGVIHSRGLSFITRENIVKGAPAFRSIPQWCVYIDKYLSKYKIEPL